MYDELLKQIQARETIKTPVVVAISGLAGSGKTYLADKLRDHFRLKNDQVLRVDLLYAEEPRGPGILDDHDWTLLTRILQDVRKGKRIRYRSRRFGKEGKQYDEPLPKIVIVEGIQLLRPELMGFFDIPVWIDCPPELALERAKTRDVDRGYSSEYLSQWDKEWWPNGLEYFNSYYPDKLATFVYKEN